MTERMKAQARPYENYYVDTDLMEITPCVDSLTHFGLILVFEPVALRDYSV